VSDADVSLLQLLDGGPNLIRLEAPGFPSVDVGDGDAVYLGGVGDEPVALGVVQ
jgi:hypothetical protein